MSFDVGENLGECSRGTAPLPGDNHELKQQVKEIQQRLQWFEQAFQDHARYLQNLQAQVDELHRRVVKDEGRWLMGDA